LPAQQREAGQEDREGAMLDRQAREQQIAEHAHGIGKDENALRLRPKANIGIERPVSWPAIATRFLPTSCAWVSVVAIASSCYIIIPIGLSMSSTAVFLFVLHNAA